MLPPRWSRLPCMNIEVNSVSHQTAWSGAVPRHPGLALAAISPLDVCPHSLPGCVIS